MFAYWLIRDDFNIQLIKNDFNDIKNKKNLVPQFFEHIKTFFQIQNIIKNANQFRFSYSTNSHQK